MHFNKFQAANKQLEHMIGKQEEKNVIKEWKTIEIKDVTFQYEIEDSNKIYIPYFVLNKGDKVSIVGKSGQGKTTFLNIFSRYLEVEKEKYKIDQKTTQGILDLVYISQEIELFNLSIRDNLCLGKDISETILRKYLAEAGLLEWIDGLEKGLETIVGERGVKLSAGQKQRLNIIRGILIDKEIYILDEPTSNLDKTTEKLIIQLIEKYLSNKTILIVTHRDEIKAICNKHYCFTENTMQLEAKTIVSSPK